MTDGGSVAESSEPAQGEGTPKIQPPRSWRWPHASQILAVVIDRLMTWSELDAD